MWLAPSIVTLLGVFSLALVGVAVASAYRFAGGHDRPENLRWLLPWSIKGLLVPLALWIVMNLGLSWELQPFLPQVQNAQNGGGSWLPIFFDAVVAGLFAISSYWAAVTLGWTLFQVNAGLAGEVRSDFRSLCQASLAGMFLPALGLFLIGGWMTLGLGAAIMLLPIVGYAPALLHPKKLPPMYARAVARMKFGRYAEAESEIIRELEKCEDDFDGWMMLAELYATRFNDVTEAEQTILEICDQPQATPAQISVALHRLADWRLNLTGDPEAARRALQVICDRLPGTHLSRMAQLRMSQLPRTAEELREQRIPQTIALPALGEILDEAATESEATPNSDQAVESAKLLAERLARDPNDTALREKLARVLAGQTGETDRAIEHMALLLGTPGQPDEKRADWLSLMAAWQFKFKHDPDAARQTMERLIREYPNLSQAFAARRRLNLMDAELRTQQARTNTAKIRILPEETKK